MKNATLPRWAQSALGIAAIVVLWQVVGSVFFSETQTLPAPTKILSAMADDGFSFYWRNASATLTPSRSFCASA